MKKFVLAALVFIGMTSFAVAQDHGHHRPIHHHRVVHHHHHTVHHSHRH